MIRLTLALMMAAGPALAASGPFFSLANTDFIVLISFLLFVGVLFYAGVPGMVTGMLDKRAVQIRSELDEAAALRDEAKAILASYERKKKDVQEQADRIVVSAREEAMRAAEEAREELKRSIARRLAGAEERIAAAETAAIREVRQRAVAVAVAAAGDLLSQQVTPESSAASIDAAIEQVRTRLN